MTSRVSQIRYCFYDYNFILFDRPFRLAISDIFRALTGSGFSVSGRVEAGVVMKDDKVLISPLNEVATVKSVDNITGKAYQNVSQQ